MRGRDDLNLPRLLEVYAVANTANYLYRLFRADASVTQLAKTYSPEQLANYVLDNAHANATIEQTVCTYAAIVALGQCSSNEAVAAMDGVNLGSLRWGSRLWSICRSNFVASSVTKIDLLLPSGTIEISPAANAVTTRSNARSAIPAPAVISTASANITSKLIVIGDINA